MKNILIFFLITALSFLLYSCSSDNPVSKNDEPTISEYVKVVTAESGGTRFEIWSSTANTLKYAYNKVGFKVYENNTEKSSGFVKFFPKMYHWANSPMHSSPVKSQFNYDNTLNMFTGYFMLTMVSDSSSFWYGFYNYNNQLYVDSVMFNVTSNSSGQIRLFTDFQAEKTYYISLVKPYIPRQGLNTFQCMLHRTTDDIHFEEINDATIYIMPWMEAMGHGSTNNIHPHYIGNGIYEGQVNFNMPGAWSVYDTVYYQGRKITENIPPRFTFEP